MTKKSVALDEEPCEAPPRRLSERERRKRAQAAGLSRDDYRQRRRTVLACWQDGTDSRWDK